MGEHARVGILVQLGVIEGFLFLFSGLGFLRDFLVSKGGVALQLSDDDLHDMMLLLELVSELGQSGLVCHFALFEEPVGDLQADERRWFALQISTVSGVRITRSDFHQVLTDFMVCSISSK